MFERSISVCSDDAIFLKKNRLPKLSIIIPFFNNSKSEIYRCLHSIDTQVYENIEVLIIDDGSSFQCRNFLDEIPLRFKGCYIKHKEHMGVSAARNYGVSIASGDYITFIDCDDAFSENFFLDLEYLFSLYNVEKYDVIYGYIKRIYKIPKHKVQVKSINPLNLKLLSSLDKEQLIREFIEDHIVTFKNKNGYLGCVSVARVVKSSIIKKTRFNEALSLNEDNIWNLQLLKNITNAIVIDNCWYYYIYNQYSVTHQFSIDIVRSYERYLDYLWEKYIIKHSYAVSFLKLTIHLALKLKRKSYESNFNIKLNLKHLFRNKPWKNEFKWAYINNLSIKEKIIFILIKINMIDFVYNVKAKFIK